MTATTPRPTTSAPRPASAPPARVPSSDFLRTVRVLAACALGIMPLASLFRDNAWLTNGWTTMLVVLGPVAVVRLWRPASSLQVWGGLGLGVLWLTAHFVPDHALGGVIPWSGTWTDVQHLFDDLHRTTSTGVAPVHTTAATNFTLCAVLALLVALVDLLAVVGRHAALAGVPLLVVFTVAGAVPRHPVHWLLFVPAAVGFLLVLSVDSADEIRGWGRLMPRAGETRAPSRVAVSGQRIAVIAIAAAVLLPLIAPSSASNLIADAFHRGSGGGSGDGSGSGSDAGFGGNGGISIDAFARLKGQLNRPQPVRLFNVTLDPVPKGGVFYLRTNVLSAYSDQGWSVRGHGATESIGSTSFRVTPDTPPVPVSDQFTATVQVDRLGGNAPVFDRPASVSGLDDQVTWSPQDQLLLGSDVRRGQTYTETVVQPNVTSDLLDSAPDQVDPSVADLAAVPSNLPRKVRTLVQSVTARATTPYQRARAVSDYFTDPRNGFVYSLQTKAGDSGSDLVDFLTNKAGYCQQYAAAMAIMLRVAGIPARVVLGYTHPDPDSKGTFEVTTNDAHAWVEAYFSGVGWVPFDPTPPAAVGGSKVDLPYAPRPTAAAAAGAAGSASGAVASNTKRAGVQSAETGGNSAASTSSSSVWPWVVIVVALLAMLAAVPAAVRWAGRRRRLAAARRGDPDPLWAELTATATDLGYVWSPARSPRQVVGWLGPQARDAQRSLEGLAGAVERSRYAPVGDASSATDLVERLRDVEASLRGRLPTSVRVRARLFPQSLGWPLPGAGRRRR